VAADYAAPHAEAADRRRRGRHRISSWGLLVAASAIVLVAAAVLMGGLWAATSDRDTTSYAISGALLRIEIDVTRGDVDIFGGSSGTVEVRRTDRSLYGHEPEEQRTLVDDVLRIESRCPSLVVGSCGADYRVTVPESVALRITADRGDVRLTAYRGSAQVSTNAGSITAGGFCGYVFQATAMGGDVAVEAVCSPENIELRTDSGDVSAAVPPGRYSIDVDTNGGTADVRGLERTIDAPWRIQALSNTGDITVEAG
jgi:Putative adhesin